MYTVPAVIEYHRATYGPDFQRDDFIPMFTAAQFDPEGLARIAEEAGMRYVVPFCKHHDGFCLWPSSFTRRNVVDMGPKRDLTGPLNEACKKRGLKFGFYFSIEEWEYPILQHGKQMIRLWDSSGKSGNQIVPYDEQAMAGKIAGKIPVEDFFDDYILPQAKEFIDLYDPDLLWLDGEWTTEVTETRSLDMVSYLYNRAAGRKEVAANDRLGQNTRFNSGDVFTSEYSSHDDVQTALVHKWEECQGISQSFGYNWQDTEENVLSTAELIEMLVRVVSENGNLLLIVNLDGQGAMPAYIQTRLQSVGEWLRINGEAIYATRPWLLAKQGDKLRFTQSKDRRFLYAIHQGWPQGEVTIDDLLLDKAATIRLLGTDRDLDWEHVPAHAGWGRGGKLVIRVPEEFKAALGAQPAIAFKIELTD
jgi:alpha-L-fucosidase